MCVLFILEMYSLPIAVIITTKLVVIAIRKNRIILNKKNTHKEKHLV